jgi:hypothetical protein
MTTVAPSKAVRKKKRAVKAVRKKAAPKKRAKKDIAESYNRYKEFGGRQYTGMQVGRSHKWYYDKGEWKETKITPDLWRLVYSVTKRRAGKAPKGSGVPVGTAYHWFICAHQRVEKLNADDYSTTLMGLKYKVAHKRAADNKWSAKTTTQRHHLIKFLKTMIRELEEEVVPLSFEYNGTQYKGEAVPVPDACENGVCYQLDITLNEEHMGIIRSMKSGWKMDLVQDQKLVDAIGEVLRAYYE